MFSLDFDAALIHYFTPQNTLCTYIILSSLFCVLYNDSVDQMFEKLDTDASSINIQTYWFFFITYTKDIQ